MQPQVPTPIPPYHQQPPYPEDEIDLMELAKKVWDGRKQIIPFLIGFIALGLSIAFLSPVEFTASSTFIPQVASGAKSGGLGGLASLAGINLGEMSDGKEIPPNLYPMLVESVKFKKALIQAKVTHPETGAPISYAEFYETVNEPGVLQLIQKYTIGLPGLILKALRGEQKEELPGEGNTLIFVSETEKAHFQRLDAQLSVTTNAKEGFVTFSFSMPTAVMSAQMATAAQQLLQEEVISFRIRNAKEQLAFTEARYKEKKEEFESIQRRLAAFRDRNKNIASATAQSDIQRLEAEFNLSFSVYNEIAKQLEQAKLQVSKDTPVFSDIQSISVPTQKSSPKRPLILVIFTFLGFILGLAWVLGQSWMQSLRKEWHKKVETAG